MYINSSYLFYNVRPIGLTGVVQCFKFADPPTLAPVDNVYLTLLNRLELCGQRGDKGGRLGFSPLCCGSSPNQALSSLVTDPLNQQSHLITE